MADDEGVGAMLLDGRGRPGDDLGVLADEIVAAHAGLAREAGGDDHHVGARDRGIVVAAGDLGVEALDRRGLGDVERLALRHAVEDVEQDDVAEFLQPGQWASVPPIWPAPISAIFLRAIAANLRL